VLVGDRALDDRPVDALARLSFALSGNVVKAPIDDRFEHIEPRLRPLLRRLAATPSPCVAGAAGTAGASDPRVRAAATFLARPRPRHGRVARRAAAVVGAAAGRFGGGRRLPRFGAVPAIGGPGAARPPLRSSWRCGVRRRALAGPPRAARGGPRRAGRYPA